MTNVRSASNKISALKKKYNLPLGTTNKVGASDAGPSVPKTTKNDKVKKESDDEGEQEKDGEEVAEMDGDEADEKDGEEEEA